MGASYPSRSTIPLCWRTAQDGFEIVTSVGKGEEEEEEADEEEQLVSAGLYIFLDACKYSPTTFWN
jgi:hypothetical protein